MMATWNYILNDSDCLSWDGTIALAHIDWRMDLDVGFALFGVKLVWFLDVSYHFEDIVFILPYVFSHFMSFQMSGLKFLDFGDQRRWWKEKSSWMEGT